MENVFLPNFERSYFAKDFRQFFLKSCRDDRKSEEIKNFSEKFNQIWLFTNVFGILFVDFWIFLVNSWIVSVISKELHVIFG